MGVDDLVDLAVDADGGNGGNGGNGLSLWYDRLRRDPGSLSCSVRSSFSSNSRTVSESSTSTTFDIYEHISVEEEEEEEPVLVGEQAVAALHLWATKMKDTATDPFTSLHGIDDCSVNPRTAVRLDPYHGFSGKNQHMYTYQWNGTDDSPRKLNGAGVVTFEDGGEIVGTWVDGVRSGRFLTASPEAGILQLVGEYKNNKLHGPGKVQMENGTIIEGEFRDGCLNGLVRVIEEEDRIQVARFRGGRQAGTAWIFREGGGCVTGEVDVSGKLTGDNIVYIYPDCSTCLVGSFHDGQLVSGQQTTLKSVTNKMGVMEVRVEEPLGGPEYTFTKSTTETICQNKLIGEPYESVTVEVRLSAAGAGDGLFARRRVEPNTVVAFYNGVRIPPEKTDEDESWEDCSYRIFLNAEGQEDTSERMDIPTHLRSTNRYCATLAHKVNHSFQPNCQFGLYHHPMYGTVPCVTTISQVAKDEELTSYYKYALCDCPAWYSQLWESLGKEKESTELYL